MRLSDLTGIFFSSLTELDLLFLNVEDLDFLALIDDGELLLLCL